MSKHARDRLEAGVRRLMDESGGVLQIYVVHPEDSAELLMAAARGRAEALVLLKGIGHVIMHLARAKPPMLCACCPAELAPSGLLSFVFVAPHLPAPGALSLALCQSCARRPDLDGRLVATLRQMWPDLRPLKITHPEGGTA